MKSKSMQFALILGLLMLLTAFTVERTSIAQTDPTPPATPTTEAQPGGNTGAAPANGSVGDASDSSVDNPTPPPEPNSLSIPDISINQVVILIAAMILALLLAWSVSSAIEGLRRSQQEILSQYIKAGVVPGISTGSSIFSSPVVIPPAPGGHTELVTNEPIEATIVGPPAITIGIPAEYTLTSTKDITAAEWTLEPASAGLVQSDASDVKKAKVLVTAAGPVKIIIKLTAGNSNGKATFDLTAAAQPAKSEMTLPNLTAGWGTLFLAIVAVSLALILGLLYKEVAAAVITLLSGALGYAFGVQKNGEGS